MLQQHVIITNAFLAAERNTQSITSLTSFRAMKANVKNASNPVRNGYTAATVPTTIVINLNPCLALGHKAATADPSAFSDCPDIRQPGAMRQFAQQCMCDINKSALLTFLE